MKQTRTYIDQFETADIQKIEHIFELLENLKFKKNLLRFCCQELKCSLVGGSIFGGVLIAFSALEMFVLDNYVSRHFDEDDDKYSIAIYELEKKKVHINELLDESVKLDFIEGADAKGLKQLYKEWRIPLGHGLRTKGLYNSSGSVLNSLGLNSNDVVPATWRTMETRIEADGLDVITEILEILVK